MKRAGEVKFEKKREGKEDSFKKFGLCYPWSTPEGIISLNQISVSLTQTPFFFLSFNQKQAKSLF